MLFSCFVKAPTLGFSGYSEEPNKRLAQQRASQKFLKSMFPNCTWNDMVDIIQNRKDELSRLIVEPSRPTQMND